MTNILSLWSEVIVNPMDRSVLNVALQGSPDRQLCSRDNGGRREDLSFLDTRLRVVAHRTWLGDL